MDSNGFHSSSEPRFAPIEPQIKKERASDSPHPHIPTSPSRLSASPSRPLPSTEAPDSASTAIQSKAFKKKGVASIVKKPTKRPRNGTGVARPKKVKKPDEAAEDGATDDEESDNGPYCLCRGPDDHRWMICCESCEDWFHGECINLDKGIGESLIEKFICPNCTSGNFRSIYKKVCTLNSCRKPARLGKEGPLESVFCSDDHTQLWWERMIGKLPKVKGGGDAMAQDEFVALLRSGLAGFDGDGVWKLASDPFATDAPKRENGIKNGDDVDEKLSGEEERLIESAAAEHRQLEEEMELCRRMLTLIELAQDRRRAAITAGRIGEDICGYDQRLDTISSRDAFAAFATSPEGENIFATSKLPGPIGEEDEIVKGMCEKKRCKAHAGWAKMLALGLRHQIRELGEQAVEVEEQGRIVRDAAGERWRRKKAEKNWVEVL